MLEVLAGMVGLVVGFGASRLLRNPVVGSGAASWRRSAASAVGARRHLDVPALQRAALSEMTRHVQPDRSGATSVPARFTVGLAADDHRRIADAPGFFTQGLEEAMAHAAARHGWEMPARLRVDVAEDPEAPPGTPHVSTAAAAGAGPAAQARPSATASPDRPVPPPAPTPRGGGIGRLTLRVVSDGTEHPVPGTRATVGRGAGCDVVIDDDRISRHHATLRCDDRSWMVRDEGSANGTRARDRRLAPNTPVRIRDGDPLWLGPVETRVVVGPRR